MSALQPSEEMSIYIVKVHCLKIESSHAFIVKMIVNTKQQTNICLV